MWPSAAAMAASPRLLLIAVLALALPTPSAEQRTEIESKWCPEQEGGGETPVSCQRPERCPDSRVLWTGGDLEGSPRRVSTCGDGLVCCLPPPALAGHVHMKRFVPSDRGGVADLAHNDLRNAKEAVAAANPLALSVPGWPGRAAHARAWHGVAGSTEPQQAWASRRTQAAPTSLFSEAPGQQFERQQFERGQLQQFERHYLERQHFAEYAASRAQVAPPQQFRQQQRWTPPRPPAGLQAGPRPRPDAAPQDAGYVLSYPQQQRDPHWHATQWGRGAHAPVQRGPSGEQRFVAPVQQNNNHAPQHVDRQGTPQAYVQQPYRQQQGYPQPQQDFPQHSHQQQAYSYQPQGGPSQQQTYSYPAQSNPSPQPSYDSRQPPQRPLPPPAPQAPSYRQQSQPGPQDASFPQRGPQGQAVDQPPDYGPFHAFQHQGPGQAQAPDYVPFHAFHHQGPGQAPAPDYESPPQQAPSHPAPAPATQDRSAAPLQAVEQQPGSSPAQGMDAGASPPPPDVLGDGLQRGGPREQSHQHQVEPDVASARPSQHDAGPRPGVRSREMCERYSSGTRRQVHATSLLLSGDHLVHAHVGDCSNPMSLVVGGQNASQNEFPHMAAVGFRSGGADGGLGWWCGGSLVSDQFVLTAAHCTHTAWGSPVIVRVGTTFLGNAPAAADAALDVAVAEVVPHPLYAPPARYHDVALLRLEGPLPLSERVRPACLPPPSPSPEHLADDDLPAEALVVATGWGRLSYAGDASDVLQKVPLRVWPRDSCARAFQPDGVQAAGLGPRQPQRLQDGLGPGMLCAGAPHSNKDTCQGDSGGPLQRVTPDNPCAFELVGVTSFGKQCGLGLPAVYTKVAFYVAWIEDIVWPRVTSQ